MEVPHAFVTLLTSDSYLPGALTLAAALKDVHPNPPVAPEVDFLTVCLVTPETVDVSSIKLLRRAFNVVIGVEIIEHDNQRGLQLLGRPDLTSVLTKLHVFRLTQFKKVIFLDADVLPTRPLSHLFSLNHEFSAVPDVGWPDIFNSGLMVLTPNETHFAELMQLSKSRGSWDGGDQGLLNEWRGDDWNRLSFTYNTTPTAAYTYAPAYERFGSKISAVHFIGPNKPWIHIPWRAPGSAEAQSKTSEPLQVYDYSSLVDRWYAVYDKHYRSTPVAASTEYAAHRYESAWDGRGNIGAEVPAATTTGDVSKTLSLDDLRRMAIEGFSGPSYAQSGEGTYLRLPLEGRLDLMRPRPINTTTSFESDGGPTTPLVDDHFFESGAAPSTTWVHQQPLLSHLAGAHGYIATPGQPYDIAQGAPFGYTAAVVNSFPWSSDSYSETEASHTYPSPSHTPRDESQPHFPAHHLKQHGHRPPYVRRRSSLSQQTLPPQSSASETEYVVPWHGAPLESSQAHRYGQTHGVPPPLESSIPPPPPVHERPASPPMVLWNPAVEPPPNAIPVRSFPTETYFTNAWDKSYRGQPGQPRPGDFFTPPPPNALFEEPPPAQIPQQLLEEKRYAKVVGDSPESTAVPDPKRVKPIFPWEESPRHFPARVFPHADAPSPEAFIQPQKEQIASSADLPASPAGLAYSPASRETLTPPRHQHSPLSPPTRPLSSSTLGYMNAWDTVPSIQKYASRLVRSPNPQPLQPPFESPETKKERRRAYGAYDSGNTSAEGDDEETDDEDRDPVEREHDLRRRARSGSLSGKGKKEYRSQGVQTIRPEMRDAAVQVAIISARPDADDEEKGSPTATRARRGIRSRQTSFEGGTPTSTTSTGRPHSRGRDSLATASQSGSASPTAAHSRIRQAQITESFVGRTQRVSPPAPPSGTVSPRLIRSPPGSSTDVTRTFLDQTPRHAPPSKDVTTPSPRVRPNLPAMTRSASMNSDALSTPSTLGPPRSPEDEFMPLSHLQQQQGRKGSRVWDPARGVEIFKKGSEEVLARFLRMGSWEDEARRSVS